MRPREVVAAVWETRDIERARPTAHFVMGGRTVYIKQEPRLDLIRRRYKWLAATTNGLSTVRRLELHQFLTPEALVDIDVPTGFRAANSSRGHPVQIN